MKLLKQGAEDYVTKPPVVEELRARTANVISIKRSRELLQKLNPDLLLVNGTRIISKKTLESVIGSFVNIHVGITPLFRGVHGGYWAMVTGKKNLFGVTIHYVDPGVDTGGIIEQVFTQPGKKDNFYTYPYLEYGVCLPALKKIVSTFVSGLKPPTIEPITNESSLWYHPTFFQWLWNIRKSMIIVFLIGYCEIIL